MSPWLLVVAGYLLGSVPASYIAGRMARGIDLREHGSGNLGATNTFRVLGARVAAPVMLFDVLKGFVPAWFFPLWDSSPDWRWALAYGAAAIVGHVFSLYMRFRGGKGVATGAGVFLALAPAAVGVAFLVWLATLWLGRMVSLASILAALTMLPLLWITSERWEVRALGGAIAAFVVFSHRANVGRILRGEEHRFGRKAAAEHPAETTVAAAAVAAEAEDVR
ncbi:MAG TPA: glycerol-3-phosphate 1-O-acyltransferase PlsY [Longimicrobiaceae bacterium]|nr:glycerol-3-phosphate 1-O-acyltransferase PlsY [Longimicrobiaceae bacterium]